MAYFVKQYTLTATATKLTTVFNGITGTSGGVAIAFGTKPRTIHSFAVIGKSGNAANGYLGLSDVLNTPAAAGQEFTTSRSASYERCADPHRAITTDDIFIVGTASDVAFITLDAD